MFTITFETDNAAFEEDLEGETVHALRVVINKINYGHRAGFVLDTNGNRIGRWSFEEE